MSGGGRDANQATQSGWKRWVEGLHAASGPQVLLYKGLHSGIPSFRGFNPSTRNSSRLFTSSAHARACKAVQRCSHRTESFRALHVGVIAQSARRSPSLCAAAGTRGTRSVGPTGVRFIPRDNSFPLSFEDSCLLVLVTKDLDVLFCTILFSESVFRKVTKKSLFLLFFHVGDNRVRIKEPNPV